MASVTELVNAWKEALANKDSSRLAEFFTEDFRFVGATTGRNNTKQETLDIVASKDNSMSIDNLEVIYENDEVAAVYHDVQSANAAVGTKAMCVGSKRDGKFSVWRVASAG